jgi:hypothetical protein
MGTLEEHELTIPRVKIGLSHDLDEGDVIKQGAEQNHHIIARAIQEGGGERFVGVEIWYQAESDGKVDPTRTTTEKDFDAVLVDTELGVIVGTYPPYDQVDPDWRSKR